MEHEHKPYLVQRLVARKTIAEDATSVFQIFEPDYMGAAEFEHGILGESLVQACKMVRIEEWVLRPITVSDDITVHYLGPESRFHSACKFLNTQLISDGSERYMAERPLKETTHLKHSYLCQAEKCRHYDAWWCLDIDHQFVFFKTWELAQLFLSRLLATDWKRLRLEDVRA